MDNITRKDLIKDYSVEPPKRLCGFHFPRAMGIGGASTNMAYTYELCSKAVLKNGYCIYAKNFIINAVTECTAPLARLRDLGNLGDEYIKGISDGYDPKTNTCKYLNDEGYCKKPRYTRCKFKAGKIRPWCLLAEHTAN